MRYRFVAAERAAFPVRALCRVVGVATSGSYAWLRRKPGRRREDDRRVGGRIAAIVAAGRRTYGGGFKWSSQHLDGGVRDGHTETAFGSVGARRVALARPARGGAARGPTAVLGGDRDGAVQ